MSFFSLVVGDLRATMETRPRTGRLPFNQKERTLPRGEKEEVRIQIFLPKLEGFSSDTRKDFLDLVRHFCRGIGCPQTISGQSTGFSNGVDHENWTPLITHSSQTAHTPSELRDHSRLYLATLPLCGVKERK
jgi:hypothetical protein